MVVFGLVLFSLLSLLVSRFILLLLFGIVLGIVVLVVYCS